MRFIRAAALVVFLACMASTIGRLTVDGTTVIGAVMVLIIAASYGAFTKGFGVADERESAELARIDEELDRADREQWAAHLEDLWDRGDAR